MSSHRRSISWVPNSDSSYSDEPETKQMNFKLLALENQHAALVKQMSSMKEALQTFIDLEIAAARSRPEMTRSQSSDVATRPVASTTLPAHSTSFSMTAEQLMYQTAKLIADSSDLEKNMKKWDDPTQNGWIKYKGLYNEYINNGGHKSLFDLCSLNVIITLKTILQINDLKTLNSKDLFNLINKKYKLKTNCQSLLHSLTMEDIKFYDRTKTERFFTKLLVLLDTHPDIYSVGEEVIVKSFFTKLKPSYIASQLLFLQIKTIADASKALEDCYMRKDQMLDEILLDQSFNNTFHDVSNDNNKVHIKNKDRKKRDCKGYDDCSFIYHKDKSLVAIESILHDLERRATLLLVNENTQPGNVSHFAKSCDRNQSDTIDKFILKKQDINKKKPFKTKDFENFFNKIDKDLKKIPTSKPDKDINKKSFKNREFEDFFRRIDNDLNKTSTSKKKIEDKDLDNLFLNSSKSTSTIFFIHLQMMIIKKS